LREQASKGGLRFEVFLPSGLAEWVLDFVERGVFVILGEHGEHRDLEPHGDLRTEILKRSLDAAINDTRPPIPIDEFKKKMADRRAEPRPEPAVWRKNTYS
jgi:antitoxin ParD1/3/4